MKLYELRRAIRQYAHYDERVWIGARLRGKLIKFAADEAMQRMEIDDPEGYELIDATFAHEGYPLKYALVPPFQAIAWDEYDTPEPIDYHTVTADPLRVHVGYEDKARLQCEVGIAGKRVFVWARTYGPLARKTTEARHTDTRGKYDRTRD